MSTRGGQAESVRTDAVLEPTVAMVAFDGTDTGEVIHANDLALALLGTDLATLSGSGFIDGLYDTDGSVLRQLVADADAGTSEPVTVRWGTTPPVRLIEARLRRRTDGTVVAALFDRSDQERLDLFLNSQASALLLQDLEGYDRWISPHSLKVLGFPAETVLGKQSMEHVHPDDKPRMERLVARAIASPDSTQRGSFLFEHPLMPGSWWQVLVTCLYLPDEPVVGGILRHLHFSVDTSNDANEDSPAGQSRHTLAELMPSGLIIANSGRIGVRNTMARRMLGAALTDDPEGWLEALDKSHRETVRNLIHRVQSNGERGLVHARVERTGNPLLWLRIEITPALNSDGAIVGYVATLLDITAEKEAQDALQSAQDQLWILANRDTLTGLPNRMQFNDRLDHAISRRDRDHQTVAVLFCDIDRFKPINDNHGHTVGDQVIAEIGRRLASGARTSDTVCRIGGDEFVVICEGFVDTKGPEILAGRLIELVSRPLHLENVDDATVGLSIGVAYARDGEGAGELVSRADIALYSAKAAGRGRCVVADGD